MKNVNKEKEMKESIVIRYFIHFPTQTYSRNWIDKR